MKKALIFLFLIQISLAHSQIRSGAIQYHVTSDKIEIKNTKASKTTQTILSNLPNYLPYISYTLTFNRTESFYQQNETMEFEGNDRYHIKYAKIRAGTSKFYTDNENNTKLIEKSFLGKEFLIEATWNNIAWKLTKEKKKIDNYTCYKAYFIDDKNPLLSKPRVVTAWFTMDIPIAFGPNGYGGLPGLILELKEGSLTYYASSIVLSNKVKEIHKPIMGEPITEEDFIDVVLEKSKKFEERSKR